MFEMMYYPCLINNSCSPTNTWGRICPIYDILFKKRQYPCVSFIRRVYYVHVLKQG